MRSIVSGVAVFALVLGATSCRLGPPAVRGVETTGLDRKLSTFAFIEEGDLVSFIVGTRTSRYHEKDAYFPVEIAVANRGLKNLTLTRESFILVDEDGNRYHAASPRELMEGYEFLDWDRDLAELEGITFARFDAFTRYPCKFSPTRLYKRDWETPNGLRSRVAKPEGATPGVVLDRVTLPRFGYLIDFIYFPTPEGGLKGKRLELQMEATELPHPVFVKFAVL